MYVTQVHDTIFLSRFVYDHETMENSFRQRVIKKESDDAAAEGEDDVAGR